MQRNTASSPLATQRPLQQPVQETSPEDPEDPDKAYYPHQPKSLSGIATRAFALGIALTLGATGTLTLLLAIPGAPHPLWRLPFLLATLATFHFLEFWTQARYNTREATTTHFLLTANGLSYTAAHALAATECLLAHTAFPWLALRMWIGSFPVTVLTLTGVLVVVGGQVVRSVAMAQAGRSFNHAVQETKRASHVLVTTGLYGTLRHPSYFGFYWWVIGIQLVLGNVVCLLAYVVVLYRYYANRIPHEEKFLVEFFGQEYVDYRKRVGTKIPFVP